MNLLLAIFLLLEAVFEGLRTGGRLLASEIVEAYYWATIIPIIFAFANGYANPIKKPLYYSWWDIFVSVFRVLVGYMLLRFALFDVIWNISAEQDIFFYGTTKLYDRFMASLGSWGWMLKGVAGIWGVAWLMGWENGIKRYYKKVTKRIGDYFFAP